LAAENKIMSYEDEINKRRTFAIISHPDAGKTTLTEKFLLFGGAIQVAGAVKSNKVVRVRHPTSWTLNASEDIRCHIGHGFDSAVSR